MNDTLAHLPDDPTILKAYIAQLQGRLSTLEEHIRQLVRQRFGASSEKAPANQFGLFNEAEQDQPDNPDAVVKAEAEITVPAHQRKKPGRKPLPEALPRVRREHDLPEQEKVCSCCGSHDLHRIGEAVSEQLDIIPAKVQVIQNVRPKYACRHCEGSIQTAPIPPQPIPGSIATPGLLAYIATGKYVDGLPLYRQEQFVLNRLGVEVARATTAQWMVRCGELVQPLVNLMRDHLLESPLIHCDETHIKVLRESGKKAQSLSYMWVQVAEPVPDHRVILFDYDPSRSGSVPVRLLEGFKGYLQTDGYEGYAAISRQEGVINQGCWAHARRKFNEAIKGLKTGAKTGKAYMGMAYIQKLYRIEREIKDCSCEEKKMIRQQKSRDILSQLRQWLDKSLPQTPPKTLLGKALNYLNNQWDKLIRYCDEGYLRMDNNLAENAIRPFVIGRKAWLFSTSQAGANASANLYSLVETAKACGLEPYAYLKEVFTQLPAAKTLADIEQLLPWNQNSS
ncbi:MAG: IS66 family transposase [Candidatus Thiodiazotropha endolucinida]|nr:IS66 family transposase [Candidatus Thiodiazotropha taylori]MCW4344097.1 IS66 family transposase [Candidatus Thiodiazotropha endolucinida]